MEDDLKYIDPMIEVSADAIEWIYEKPGMMPYKEVTKEEFISMFGDSNEQ